MAKETVSCFVLEFHAEDNVGRRSLESQGRFGISGHESVYCVLSPGILGQDSTMPPTRFRANSPLPHPTTPE